MKTLWWWLMPILLGALSVRSAEKMPHALDAVTARALRATKNARVVVEQTYEADIAPEEDSKEEFATSLRDINEPFAGTMYTALALAGVNVVEDENSPAELVVTIKARGKAVSADYVGINVGGRQFTGAELEGELVLTTPEHAMAEYSFQSVVPIASTIQRRHLLPGDAPFYVAFASYQREVMRMIGEVYGVDALAKGLATSDVELREAAARALGSLGGPDARKRLVAALADPSMDDSVLGAAALSLGEIGDREALAPLIAVMGKGDARLPELIRHMTDSGPAEEIAEMVGLSDPPIEEDKRNPYQQIVAAIERLSAKGSIEPLLGAMADHSSVLRRAGAACVLGRIGARAAFDPLVEAMHDRSFIVRSAATFALGRSGDLRAIQPLVAATRDASVTFVARAAEEGLENIREAKGDGLLREAIGTDRYSMLELKIALQDRNAIVRLAAVHKAEGSGQTELLQFALRDDLALVRRLAAATLEKMDDARSAEALIDALRDPDEATREAAVRSVAEHPAVRAVDPLISNLGDNDYNVRFCAIQALDRLGDQRAVVPLIGRLKDSEVSLQINAAVALGKLKDPRAIPALEEMAAKGDEVVRPAAQEALESIRGRL